jgi:hypothetical protein
MSILRKLLRKAIATPNRTGQIGESRIAAKLSVTDFLGRPGQTLQNVYIPVRNNQTTEIDLLYITRKGIFVIESKNYSGYIFGSEQNQYWTATLYGGKGAFGRSKVEKHQFYNPLMQNCSHIKALTEYLKQPVPCFSIIVFSNRCELKSVPLYPQNAYICQRNGLNRVISDIWESHSDYFTDQQVTSLYSKLLLLAGQDSSVKQQHIQNIQVGAYSATQRTHTQTAQAPTEHDQPTLLCPRCGRKLVLRTAKNGTNAGSQFWGCSGYPSCRYTSPYK